MLFFKKLFYRHEYFQREETAATAIEYSLIAAAIAVAIMVVVFALGDQIVLLIESLATALSGP